MWRIVCLSSLLVVFAGCQPASEPPADSELKAPDSPMEPAPAGQSESSESGAAKDAAAGEKHTTSKDSQTADVDDVQLKILNWEQTQDLVKSHRGQVVVMDIWATYCPPCIAEFPNLVRLNREHGEQVACISVSADYDGLDDRPVESYREKVMKFLVKQGATFENVLLSISAEKLFSEKISQQSIPIVYVYDQQGKLRGTFPDPEHPEEFTYQKNILPLVGKLLAHE